MNVPASCFLFRISGRWQLLAAILFAVAVLFFFHPKKPSVSIDGLWVVCGRECLVECKFPAVAPRVTDICIRQGSVVMRVGTCNYDGSITFNNDQFDAAIDPIYFGPNLQRAYVPNGRVGLFGRFHMSDDSLILDVDEIGDVLDTSQNRGSAPATWRFHLQRKSSACDLHHFIMTHFPRHGHRSNQPSKFYLPTFRNTPISTPLLACSSFNCLQSDFRSPPDAFIRIVHQFLHVRF
jgi:hypothetical protein